MARIAVSANVQKEGVGGDLKYVPTAAAARGSVDVAQALTDFDAAGSDGTNGVAHLLGTAAAYSTTTHQYSGTISGNATITPTQGAAMYALLNTVGADLVAAKGAGSADVTIDINLANVTSWSRLVNMVTEMLKQLRPSMSA